MYTNPTVAEFKAYFPTNFPYGNDPYTQVTDTAIQKAIDEAALNINQSLFCSQNAYTTAMMYLSAHYLVSDLLVSGSQCAGQEQWLISSKSVGSVSESFSIPQRILDNPLFAWYSTTRYGNRYLMMIMPLLSGQVFIVGGATTA